MTDHIEQRLRQHAAAHPDAVAAASFHRSVTAAELDHDADRVAAFLRSEGVEPGSRVALLSRNRVEAPAVIVGARRTRATFVGCNFGLSPEEMAETLDLTRPDVIIAEPHLEPLLTIWRERADPRVALLGEEGAPDPWGDLHDVVVGPGDIGDPGAHPDDEAMVYFTSGTSGRAKAVSHSLGACELAASRHSHLELTPESTELIVPPSFHVAGGLWTQFGLHAGATVVLLSQAPPVEMLRAIERFGVTHAIFVPTLIKMLLDALDTAGADAPSMETLHVIGYGASPIPPTLLERAMDQLGCRFFQAYGMTEMNGVVSQLTPEDHHPPPEKASRVRSAGQPVEATEIRVVEPGTTDPVEIGVDGELQFRSPLRMLGYLDNPEATKAAFTADGFFRSGDVGHLDGDGYLYLTDRVSDMIITGGENVYPIEVENVLTAAPGVGEAAVFGVPDEHWGERVVAVLVAAPGAEIDLEEVDASCRARLAGYKRPRNFRVIDELPRNAAGKILRRDLRSAWS